MAPGVRVGNALAWNTFHNDDVDVTSSGFMGPGQVANPLSVSAEATAFGRNPIFLVKMALIIVGLTHLALYHRARQRVLMHPPISPRAR